MLPLYSLFVLIFFPSHPPLTLTLSSSCLRSHSYSFLPVPCLLCPFILQKLSSLASKKKRRQSRLEYSCYILYNQSRTMHRTYTHVALRRPGGGTERERRVFDTRQTRHFHLTPPIWGVRFTILLYDGDHLRHHRTVREKKRRGTDRIISAPSFKYEGCRTLTCSTYYAWKN